MLSIYPFPDVRHGPRSERDHQALRGWIERWEATGPAGAVAIWSDSTTATRGTTPRPEVKAVPAIALAHSTMSLDGFIAGPNHEMDWVFDHAADVPGALIEDVISTTGAILSGRRAYEVGRRAARPETSKPFGGRWRGPLFILTHSPPDDESDPAYSFLSGDVREAAATALAAAQGRNLLVLGADVVGQCLREGVLDEILIHILPVLLGDGVPLFGEPPAQASLQTLHASHSGQVVNVRYRVRR